MDNVWNEDNIKWVEFKNLVVGGASGRKIVVTTRSNRVAEITGTISCHYLKAFPYEKSLSLFLKFAFKKGKEKQHPNLVKIGQAIVKKCQGIPLVVKDLGGNGLQHLKSLQLLVIYGCPNLKYLFQEIQELTSLNTLVIAACKNLVSLPLGLENLTALQSLIIADCEQLNLSRAQGFQEKIEKVEEDGFSLLSLGIVNLPKLGALPQWLLRGSANTLKNLTIAECVNLTTSVEWHNLTSLEKPAIIHCPQLLSLPNNMQRLKQLKIEYCPLLSQRCQQGTGVDWLNIVHASFIVLDGNAISANDN
ncbi:putative disease resistance protein RGA3 [Gossypium raimondii]|uniref:putative disease resistance protein RGA3 n=1 Tax=Gossypium raimondii TaxID=29730 RepID=UPI00227D1F17|nr:putative disease resistance protein RGA3 [Gossypium raimondii]